MRVNEHGIADKLDVADQVCTEVLNNSMLDRNTKTKINSCVRSLCDCIRQLMYDISELYDGEAFIKELTAHEIMLNKFVEIEELETLSVPKGSSKLTRKVIRANNMLITCAKTMAQFVQERDKLMKRQPCEHVVQNVYAFLREKKMIRDDMMARKFQSKDWKALFSTSSSVDWDKMRELYTLKTKEDTQEVPF